MTIGNGLRLFVSDKDLRWAGLGGAGDISFSVDQLTWAVRVALRLFHVMPVMADEPKIEVERSSAMRGYEITVMAPFLTSGFANALPLAIEARITHVDGREFSGEFVTVPKEPDPPVEKDASELLKGPCGPESPAPLLKGSFWQALLSWTNP